MSAIKLLDIGSQQDSQYLREQLTADESLGQDIWECAERYLLWKGILNVTLIEEDDFREYKTYLKENGQYTLRQIAERSSALRRLHAYWINKEYGELLGEIEACLEAETQLTGNVKRFLIRQGIHHVREIDYRTRQEYEEMLLETKKPEHVMRYLKCFDRIKQYDIRQEMSDFSAKVRKRLQYENQIIFLPYLPNQNLAMEFDKVQDKKELVWDFAQETSENLKRQVFMILTYILDNVKTDDPKDRRVRYLLPLKWLYEFCVKEGIEDIERLETSQIQQFEQVVAGKVVNVKNSMQIVDNSRKILFLGAKEIHWYANVWYLEKFHFSPDRINPSNPVHKITFLEVTNLESRGLLQDYARYQVGVSGLTIANIRSKLGAIKKFLACFAEVSVCRITQEQIDSYFKELQNDETQAETVNKKITEITEFYQYLESKGHIKQVPYVPAHYLQKTYPIHHDRSVEEAVYMEILQKLRYFPDKPRLIFLHLWAAGLRVSEVCTLKGNAYYWDGEDAWIKIYQIKMKADKMIPIPLMLYRLMQQYMEKNHIHAKDYVFQGQKGAYRVGSFMKTFKYHCLQNQIANSEYVFKSHDYRHTLATRFYDDGVSLQTIRDYLGHLTEEMTKQYVDYLPTKVASANEEYFKKPGNDLAGSIQVKKRGEKHEKKNTSI